MAGESIAIITLLSKDHLDRKEFVAHIDVVLSKHAESTAKKRTEKEGYIDDRLCLNNAGISPPIQTILDKNKQVQICYEISGCLEPRVPFIEGQNTLLFNGGNKPECKRSIPLKPVHAKEPTAAITFKKKDNTFLHQVVINVPRDILPTPEDEADAGRNVPVSTSGLAQSTTTAGQNSMLSSRSSGASLSGCSSDGAMSMTVLSDSCRSMTLDEGRERCLKLLSEKSLLNLAEALGPNDGYTLAIHLGISNTAHNTNMANNPGNIVKAIAASLSIWNKRSADPGDKLDELVDKLRQMGRNDLKSKILKFYEEDSDKLEFI